MPSAWDSPREIETVKVHRRWWTSPSHLELGVSVLGIGQCLMGLAMLYGRRPDGSGWVVDQHDRPVTVTVTAREAHTTPKAVRAAIDELLKVGTLARREDGAVGFPNLRKWQESDAARRMRRKRHRDRGGVKIGVTVTGTVTEPSSPPTPPPSPTTAFRSEAEIQRELVVKEQPRARAAEAPNAVSNSDSGTFLVFPVKGPKREWHLSTKLLRELEEAYGRDLDVRRECELALTKIRIGAVTPKTPRGMPRFLTSWLDRALERPAKSGSGKPERSQGSQRSRPQQWQQDRAPRPPPPAPPMTAAELEGRRAHQAELESRQRTRERLERERFDAGAFVRGAVKGAK